MGRDNGISIIDRVYDMPELVPHFTTLQTLTEKNQWNITRKVDCSAILIAKPLLLEYHARKHMYIPL